jgi:hypothetical protein
LCENAHFSVRIWHTLGAALGRGKDTYESMA